MPHRAEFEWQMEDYLRVFWLHKGLIVAASAAFGVLTAAHMARQPNVYQTAARIVIEVAPPKLVQFQDISSYASAATTQNFLQTEYQVISSRAVVSRVLEELRLASFPPFSRARDPVSLLQQAISVEPVRGTKLVDIRVTGKKPELITRIANATADLYARQNLERRQEATTGGVQWLREEIAKMETQLRQAQQALQAFKEKYSSVDFGPDQQNTVLQRLQALSTAVTETRKQRIDAQLKYRERHPVLEELEAKERELQAALYEQEKKALEMNRLNMEYTNLLRDAKTSENLYNILLTRMKELSVTQGLQGNNVQVVDYALVPAAPIGPMRGQRTATATLLGLALGCGLAFLLEILSKTVRTRGEFEQLLEISFLGHISLVRARGAQRKGRAALQADLQPAIAEEIRAIRTTLEFLLPSGQPHTLLVTSSLPAEGKSFTSFNLALALQEVGRKVLLVDADMRRPSIHRTTQVDLEPGLSAYLEGKAEAEELVRLSPEPQSLAVIPVGVTPSQPTDLLTSPRFLELLEKLKPAYQYILIDSPPVLVAADSAVISTAVEGVLFVLLAERTHREAALVGKQRLVDVGAKLIGGVLNGARVELVRGYRYYYYHGNRYYKKAAPAPGRQKG